MNRSVAIAITVLATLTTACKWTESDLADVLPDERLEINFPAGDTNARTAGPTEWSTYYLLTADVTEEVNGMVGTVLYWLDTITTEYPPTYLDSSREAAEWGPWNDGPLDPVETLLWVTHNTDTDGYDWGLNRWPKNLDQNSERAIITGQVDPGATHEINSGRFAIDFTANNELDPTDEATGYFDVDYDIQASGVSGTATFTDFGPNAIDASYVYAQTFDGDGQMDLGTAVDMNPESGTGLQETWLVRSRWLQTGAGRSDVVVTDGDLGQSEVNVSECWDESFQQVYYTESLSGTETGDVGLCAFADANFPL